MAVVQKICVDLRQSVASAFSIIGMNLPIGLGAAFPQRGKKDTPILRLPKDGFQMVAPAHDMIHCARIWQAKFSRHARDSPTASLFLSTRNASMLGNDPFTPPYRRPLQCQSFSPIILN